MVDLFLFLGIGIGIYMTCWFIASIFLKDASIVDIAWGLGFIVIGLVCVFLRGLSPVFAVALVLVSIWGVRLSMHILKRKLRNPHEDFRYAKWRRDWGSSFILRSFFQVFLLQGVFMLLIALPLIWISYIAPSEVTFSVVLGILVWIFGFLFESIADHQLTEFKSSPSNRGKLMTSGLWSLSRHPNYFGESVQWWGVWLLSLSTPYGWLLIVSPLTITLLIRFVSGVPMLEKKYEGRPDFERYKKQTNAFIPWFSHL